MNEKNKEMSELHAYYGKVELIAAWEIMNKIPFQERLTYWFGDYGMDAPKYEHRDKIDGMYEQIISQGHPSLNTGNGVTVYRQSEEFARAHGELEAYRSSDKHNVACAGAIDLAVRTNHTKLYPNGRCKDAGSADGYDLEGAVQSVAAEYGYGRTSWVLANVIRKNMHDGQLSYENRQWARAFPIPVEHKPSFNLSMDSVILDGFTTEARKIFEAEVREHTPISFPSEKPSVMEQIREVRKGPAPPKTDRPTDKGSQGLDL